MATEKTCSKSAEHGNHSEYKMFMFPYFPNAHHSVLVTIPLACGKYIEIIANIFFILFYFNSLFSTVALLTVVYNYHACF